MLVVSLYRVSTERQENEGASLDAQQRRFRELAERESWTVIAEFRGQESAAKAASERVVLQQVLACIRTRQVDALWVYEQSRLTRGDELEVAVLIRELRERQIQVLVDTSVRDLTDINDALAFGVQSLVDRAEWARFRERVIRGKREKARQGKKANGAAPYGYRNPPSGDPRRGTLQVVAEQARWVRQIYEWIAAGVSLRQVCSRLNERGVRPPRGGRWGKTTIQRILDNPAYRGAQVSGAWIPQPGSSTRRLDLEAPHVILTEDAHEPLVPPELWEAARRQRRGSSTGHPGLLTGLLWIDGERAGIDRSRGRSFYRPTSGGAWIDVDGTNRAIWGAFRALALAPEAFEDLLEASADTSLPEALRQEVAALEGQIAKLDPVEQARRTIFRTFAGHGTTSRRAHRTGFRAKAYRQRASEPVVWAGWPDIVPIVVERLRGVIIENRIAEEVIAQHDGRSTLFYVDPPYVPDVRSSLRYPSELGRAYAHDASDDDHRRLAQQLHKLYGMVVLSGYRCSLYDELFGSWESFDRDTLADGGKPRTETLWLNPSAASRRVQLRIDTP